MCVLSDHQPANHQEFELSVIGEITEGTKENTENSKEHCAQGIISELEDARTQRISSESDTVMFRRQNEHCAQVIISEFENARTQKISSESNTVVIEAEIHAENTDAQHMVQFEEAQEFSDAGSLITQAPQSQSIHATINALSTWVSAIQPRESWYLAGWIGDSPIDFLVDPGAVVSAISLQSYEKLMESNAILTPMKAMHMELEAANKSDMRVHGMCNLELSVHGLIINIDAVVVDLNCHAILGMDILVDASKLPFILDLVKGTLSGGGYETIQLHRFQAATECFAETTYAVPSSTWNLQDENCILSMKSNCSIDVKGYRFFTMERLFYALQLLGLGDRKFIGQLAKYSRMDYIKKCVNTRFELASRSLQDKWLDEQFQTWTQIITARILSDPVFKQALLDSAGSPLFDPEEPVYATALTSARKMCVQRKLLCWPTWITLPTRVTRGQARV